MAIHPRVALYAEASPPPVIPACEHFAGNERFIRKALGLQAAKGPVFDVTCDLEDGAPAGRERETAEMVAALINDDANRFDRLGVRIHPHGHPAWKSDVEIVLGAAAARVAYVTIPKVETRMAALQVASYVYHVAEEAGVERRIPIHVLIETHGGLREVHQIAELGVVEGVVFGLLDFVSSHHGAIPSWAMASPGQFEHPLVRRAKLEIAAAAHGHGRIPVHNVTTELGDPAVVRADAKRARDEFGYLRMYSIHPDQIDPIVAAMQPDRDEVETASAILLAAGAADWAPVRHDGKLHDRASYRYFWQVLERADATGATIPAEARRAFFQNNERGVHA
jgi:citrate lyase subunit beta/citryl-CoA lyase